MQGEGHYLFDICTYGLRWEIERLLWIGYYKSKKNNKCLIQTLPKEILLKIIVIIDDNKKHHQPFQTYNCNVICLHDK